MASNFHGWHTHWPVFSDKLVLPGGRDRIKLPLLRRRVPVRKRKTTEEEFLPKLLRFGLTKKPGEFSQKIPVASFVDCFLNPGRLLISTAKKLKYPEVKMVMWTGGNPFSHQPETNRLKKAWSIPETVVVSAMSGVRRQDMLISFCQPQPHLKRNDIVGIGTYTNDGIVAMHKAVEAPGEAKSDYEIYTLLAEKLGLKRSFHRGSR